MKLDPRLVEVDDLSAEQRDHLFALMDRHYENVQRDVFEADLAEKQWVILVTDAGTQQVCGFSTQRMLEVEVEGVPVVALFSGDTIIDQAYWGDPGLARVWGQLALSLIDEYVGTELYWFLLSKGYKTYRFLPLFFREYYPRLETQTPPRIRKVLDALALQRYPEEYDPRAGIVRTSDRQYWLRRGVADVTAGRLQNPHVQFFESLNPGASQGDELCCLAPLRHENFTPAAYRVMKVEPVGGAAKCGQGG